MSNKRTQTYTSATQRNALAEIRNTLAGEGYLRSPVVSWYKKHRNEFLMIPKDKPQEFVLVRPQRNGVIHIRPFACTFPDPKVRKLIEKLQSSGMLVRWHSQRLRYAAAREDWWFEFIPPYMRKELPHLVYTTAVEAKPPLS